MSGRIRLDAATRLVCLARAVLCDSIAQGAPAPRAREAAGARCRVNVTVITAACVRASMSGRGTSLAEAVRVAARHAAADRRFGAPLSVAELARARVEVWICRSTAALRSLRGLDLGLHGVELRRGRRGAYFKPSVALTQNYGRADLLLERLCLKAGLEREDWRAPDTLIRRTIWEHFTEAGPNSSSVVQLARLRPVDVPALNAAALRERIRWAAARLVNAQQPDWLFLYQYHPFRPLTQPPAPQLVRQAGTAFGLARAAALGDAAAARAALRAAEALLGLAVPGAGGGLHLANGKDPAPLGAGALLSAALELADADGRLARARESLRAGLLARQTAEGAFLCHTDSVSPEADGAAQDFFPGEAMMALALALSHAAAEVRPALRRAFAYYRAHFRRAPATAFIVWQTEAARLYLDWLRAHDPGSPEIAALTRVVFAMIDWLLPLQLDEASARHPHFAGGFARGHPPGYSSAVFTEAVALGAGIAARAGDARRARRYAAAARRGLLFTMRLQIVPETAFLFPEPALTVGGTTASLSDLTIRCDFDQHAITAYAAGLGLCRG